MKGIILAGGTGSRLYPLTKVTNKHLLPIGSYPMIHYPITSLTKAGISSIMVITGTSHMGDTIALLGSGREYDCDLTFKVQDQPDGIAGALRLCKNFVGNDRCVVILADNIFDANLSSPIDKFKNGTNLCELFFVEVPDPERYGVGSFKEGRLLEVEEKPKHPKSNLACIGIYMYTPQVFEAIESINKSDRGEYEISSVNNYFINKDSCGYSILDGRWADAGTIEAYHKTNRIMYEAERE
tara:strand:- start:1037 stop:1756 length:720 start_codon:yes stop_codon:yes gene_type:complete